MNFIQLNSNYVKIGQRLLGNGHKRTKNKNKKAKNLELSKKDPTFDFDNFINEIDKISDTDFGKLTSMDKKTFLKAISSVELRHGGTGGNPGLGGGSTNSTNSSGGSDSNITGTEVLITLSVIVFFILGYHGIKYLWNYLNERNRNRNNLRRPLIQTRKRLLSKSSSIINEEILNLPIHEYISLIVTKRLNQSENSEVGISTITNLYPQIPPKLQPVLISFSNFYDSFLDSLIAEFKRTNSEEKFQIRKKFLSDLFGKTYKEYYEFLSIKIPQLLENGDQKKIKE
jgi:hypothetical protein